MAKGSYVSKGHPMTSKSPQAQAKISQNNKRNAANLRLAAKTATLPSARVERHGRG